MEAHGGRIWAESGGPGLGTRVAFTIPAVEESKNDVAPEPEAIPDPQQRTDGGETRILSVDDDPQMLWFIRRTLSEFGHALTVTGNPGDIERLIQAEDPHLILLDLIMPGVDGFELLNRIPEFTDAPVIILSGYANDRIIAEAFEFGAADYILKPFSPTELDARIRATIRRLAPRGKTRPPEQYAMGALAINYEDREVVLADMPVQVTPTEYRLLHELSTNAGRVMTYEQLLRRIWGPNNSGDARLVRGIVKSLRRKLGEDAKSPTYIHTVPRVGYRMTESRPPGA